MAIKDYQNDYPEPKFPSGHFHIDPKESFEIDYIYESILSRNRMVLESGSDLVQIFRMKTSGTRCTNPSCPAYNNYDQNGAADCLTCLGTGYVSGYDYVEEIKVRFPMEQEVINIQPGGLLRQVKPRAWTMPDPVLHQFDIAINFNLPQVTQDRTEVDVEVFREPGVDLDSIPGETFTEYRQLVRILKIADNRNSAADYKEGVDYAVSNNGILWITDNRPGDDEAYYVIYKVSERYYRRYEINNISPSPWRGRILSQRFDITELPLDHPAYKKIEQSPLGADEASIVYNPFPVSEWYDRE
jgi:hypothetical protein